MIGPLIKPGRRRAGFPVVVSMLAGIVVLLLAGCSQSSPPQRTSGPNIVFVLTDDLSSNLVKYMPHVQALQRAGLTFRNYYVVDSLCCPSRAALMTGEYPHDDGVYTNNGRDGGYAGYLLHGDSANSYGPALERSGYRTGFMGKYLNGYYPQDPVAPGWNEWAVAGNGYDEYRYTLNVNGNLRRYGSQPRDYLTDVLARRAHKFIASSGDQPFALEVATFAPHKPSPPAPRDATSFLGVRAPRTAAYDRLPTNPPPWMAHFPPIGAGEQARINTKFLLRVQSVQAVDDMVGRIEAQLRARGQLRNTYFVFSSDNGYHMGEHRLFPGKQTAYDTDIRVPLVVAGPGISPGSTTAALASSIDLAPTFESLAGLSPSTEVDGTSLVPVLHGHTPSNWQQAVLIEHHGPDTDHTDPDYQHRRAGNPPSYEAVRTATQLYVRYDTSGAIEYYNTATDPQELSNRPAAAPAELPQLLDALQHCHGAASCQRAASAP